MRQERKDQIRAVLAHAIDTGRKDVVKLGVEQFGVSRQTISNHLAAMVEDGILDANGKTRGRVYRLRVLAEKDVQLDLAQQPAEDEVWQAHFAPLVSALPKNVLDICHYGFAEIFNNAVEHSEGNNVGTFLSRTYASTVIRVHDDGIGIFRKIKNGLGLANEREAILELTKGKVTTDPTRHSGEGIFFTSRMFDGFVILSGRLSFCHHAPNDDWLIDKKAPYNGTGVTMQISLNSPRNVREVFDRYTTNTDSPAFDKTQIPVGLLCVGDESVVSRSQGRRLLAGMDRFREIVLDFSGVEDIGQAFADEVFRVFRRQNPDVNLNYVRANKRVEGMIHRALNSRQPTLPGL